MKHQPILQTHQLTIGYGGCALAERLDLTLPPGRLVCLLGPNGAGKSTLMQTLTGMLSPLSGSVSIGGADVRRMPPRTLARTLSMVLTTPVDVGQLTAYELAGLGRHPYTGWLGRLSADDHAIIAAALESVGAMSLRDRIVTTLSDGERQKVLIARALVQEPQLILLDEPTAFLDLPHRVSTLMTLRTLAHEQDIGVLMSTHDLDLAMRNADTLWLMDGRGGLVTGAPEDLALSGDIAAAFEREGVTFDLESGAFTTAQNGHRAVHVSGAGAAVAWTRRALIRAGYRVTDASAAGISVQVAESDGSARWVVYHPGGVVDAASIEGLLGVVGGV